MIDLETAIKKLGLEHHAGLQYLGTDHPRYHWAVVRSAFYKPDGTIAEQRKNIGYGLTWQDAIKDMETRK